MRSSKWNTKEFAFKKAIEEEVVIAVRVCL